MSCVSNELSYRRSLREFLFDHPVELYRTNYVNKSESTPRLETVLALCYLLPLASHLQPHLTIYQDK